MPGQPGVEARRQVPRLPVSPSTSTPRLPVKFGKLFTEDALAAAEDAAKQANLGLSSDVWYLALEMLRDQRLAKKTVGVIVEAQLYIPFFLEARKGVHIFYKAIRAKSLAELAQDCAKYATSADMAFAPTDGGTRTAWKVAAAERLAVWVGLDLS